jgi:capsular exopolysaccharide synthesis family protein
MPAKESDLSRGHMLVVLRRRYPIVIVCVVVAVVVALAYSLQSQKLYTATASLLFNDTPLSQQIAGLQAVPNSNQQSQQDTNTELLKLGNLAQATAAEVGHSLTPQDVTSSLAIAPQGDTTLVNVSATLPSPGLAAHVANTYARVFVNQQENGNREYYAAALATVEKQLAQLSPTQAHGAQGLALQNRAQSLATLAQLRNDTVSLAQAAAVPASPSSPKLKRNVLVAAVLGLLLGVALAFVAERLDQHIREPEDLESVYGLPLLGAVPQSSALQRGGGASRPTTLSGAVADTFLFIRARLRYFNVDRAVRTLAVVSAQPEDGKTTIAHWLANAAAGAGTRTLIVEADMRRPSLANEIGLAHGPGLADLLMRACPFDEAVQTADVRLGAGGVQETCDVIVAGALPPNPAEMLESRAMVEVLERARSNYDLTIIDTPPLGVVPDAMPLLSLVDGVAIVASVGRSRRDAAGRLRTTLTSVNAPVLGVIANRVKVREAGYGYGYDYRPVGEPDAADRHVVRRDGALESAGPAAAAE